jgi:hypothetical protein
MHKYLDEDVARAGGHLVATRGSLAARDRQRAAANAATKAARTVNNDGSAVEASNDDEVPTESGRVYSKGPQPRRVSNSDGGATAGPRFVVEFQECVGGSCLGAAVIAAAEHRQRAQA